MQYVWIAVFIVMVIVETATVQLVSVWFAIGALGALVSYLCGVEDIRLQILIFAVVSVISLLLTRPFLRKFIKSAKQPTNADMVIGQTAVVRYEIDNIKNTGIVFVNGNDWTARSTDGSVIKTDTLVTVDSIEGVKLFVSQKQED